MINKDEKTQRGFTLIELLIVVSILGILGGISAVVLNPDAIRGDAEDSVRLTNVRKITEAAETYANMEGSYPADSTTLQNSAYIANWPDGNPTVDDVYTYTYDTSEDVFEASVEKDDAQYYVYTSFIGDTVECPTPSYDADDCNAVIEESEDVETDQSRQAVDDLEELYDAILAARIAEDQVLRYVTGSACSGCPCRGIGPLDVLPDSHTCVSNWLSAKNLIDNSAGYLYDLSGMDRDPWGSPYLIDENELELWHGIQCRIDTIRTAGPDKIHGTSDDIVRSVPHYMPTCP